MKSVNCTHLVVDSDLLSYAESLNEPSFRIVITADTIKSQDGLLDDTADVWPDYPEADAEALSVEALTGVLTFMHTSGSTGHPKIVPYRHRWILTVCAVIRRQRPQSFGCSFYTIMPLFHSIGVLLTYVFSVGLAGSVHFLNLRQPPTSAVVLRHLALHGERPLEILLPPSILEDIVDGELRSEGLKLLKRAAIIIIGGAPLRKDVGDFLRHGGAPLQTLMGMTETGPLSLIKLSKDAADWQYMELNDGYKYFFKALGSQGTAKEMIVLPKENTPCVINHRDPEGLATNDLWEQHPDREKSHLWKIMGRGDDVTVLSYSEKTDNKQLENLLCTSALINSAAVFGTGRLLNGVIICPTTPLASYDPASVSEYLDAVWPHITDKVNPIIPQHSVLIRPLVLVAMSTRPFILTDKQSLNRKLTLKLYVEEIDAAYTRVEEGEYEEVQLPEAGLEPRDTESYVQAVVSKLLSRRVPLSMDEDLFDAGLESLLAMRIRSSILAALRKSGKAASVPRNIAYTLPTQRGLAMYLKNALLSIHGQSSVGFDITSNMTDAIDEFTADLPQHRPAVDAIKPDGDVYAVTGTTGSFGSFFVSSLLNKPEVRKIYLLNRQANARGVEERHQSVFHDRGIEYDLLAQAVKEGRAEYVEAALGKKNLGLSQAIYDELRKSVTHIVHTAWKVDFNLSFPSFKTHIQGVRTLLDLALSSMLPTPAQLIFLSSVAVVADWNGPAPEESLDSPYACLNQGYAYSKYVAEKIIERAVAQRQGLKAVIIRSGQIAGAEGSGAWSSKEHIPILFKSCVDFGFVPDRLPTVRWLPINVAAQVVYLQIQAASVAPTQPVFFNLETSCPTEWSLIANTLANLYVLPIVPTAQWIERVRKRTDHPVNKLLEFFENYVQGTGMPALRLDRTRGAVGGLVDYVVNEELISLYARYACR
ncbi:acetyl-CoA synthetase-like protein [Mycena crocata]|nr:acetyl-CoA synthetase-like protein [Mycena crocata]